MSVYHVVIAVITTTAAAAAIKELFNGLNASNF